MPITMARTPDAPTVFKTPDTLECLSCGVVDVPENFFGNYCIDCEEDAGEDGCCISCSVPLTDDEAADSMYCDECR